MRLAPQNLTESVRASIIEAILAGTYLPGARIPSEREYALMTGTSRVTVRRAYDQLQQAGIIVRQQHGGTRLADTFRANTAPIETIGLITPMPFSTRFVEAVSASCDNLGALLTLGLPNPVTASQQLNLAKRMTFGGVRDIIIWCADRDCDFKLFANLRILGVNLVFCDQVIPGQYADYVGLDNQLAIRSLFRRALENQARHLTFITDHEMAADTNVEREQTFRQCLRDTGVRGEVRSISHRASRNEFQEFVQNLPPTDAIIAVNATLLQRCFTHPVPRPQLYCVDYEPGLAVINATGYCQPISAMAETAVQMLMEQRRKGERWHATSKRLPGEIIEP